MVSNEIVDILAAIGIVTPDISILPDEFLTEIQQIQKKHLALEALRKLRKSARARMRAPGEAILRKHGYPGMQDVTVQTVLRQAEALSASWIARVMGLPFCERSIVIVAATTSGAICRRRDGQPDGLRCFHTSEAGAAVPFDLSRAVARGKAPNTSRRWSCPNFFMPVSM